MKQIAIYLHLPETIQNSLDLPPEFAYHRALMLKSKSLPKNTGLSKKIGVVIGLVFVGVLISRSELFCSKATAACETTNKVAEAATLIAPQYYTFSQEKLTEDLAENKTVVLYFHAPWCTTCSSFDHELKAQTSQLPANVEVLRIDYDSSMDLRTQYSVTYQHTLVLLNSDGSTREMWLGGDLNSLLDYLKKNS